MQLGAGLLLGGFALAGLASPVLDPIEATVNDRGQVYIYRELMSLISGIPGIAHHENPTLADRLAYLRSRIGDLGLISTGLVAAPAAALEVAATFGLLASVRAEFFLLPTLGFLRVWSGTVAPGRTRTDWRVFTAKGCGSAKGLRLAPCAALARCRHVRTICLDQEPLGATGDVQDRGGLRRRREGAGLQHRTNQDQPSGTGQAATRR
jgi:hypothetical protein